MSEEGISDRDFAVGIVLTLRAYNAGRISEVQAADRGGRAFIESNANWVCVSPDGKVIEAKR